MQRMRAIAVGLAIMLGVPSIGLAITDTKGVITFTKTVGLGPACAPDGQVGITVAPGTTVTYCYKIVSSKGVTLTLVSLDDDQLGHLFSPLCPNCVSAPPPPAGNVLTPTVPFVITTTTQIFRTTLNVATWTVNFTSTIDPTVTVMSEARVSVPSTAKAPTLSGVGLALVAFALLVVGAVQLTVSRKGVR